MATRDKRDMFGNVKEELEKGLRDKIKIDRLIKGNPGHIIKVEGLLKLKIQSKFIELEDKDVELGINDPVGDAVSQLVLELSDEIKGEKVFDYEVRVEFGRDTDNESTLIGADVIYAVPLEEVKN